MKELRIRGWEQQAKDIDGDNYTIQYGVDKSKAYRLSIKSERTPNYYQMSIDKELRSEFEDYQVWLYNMNENISSPMSIQLYNLSSKDSFISYLEGIIALADKGEFDGSIGNSTTQPN